MLCIIVGPCIVELLVRMLPGLNDWPLICLWWVCSGEAIMFSYCTGSVADSRWLLLSFSSIASWLLAMAVSLAILLLSSIRLLDYTTEFSPCLSVVISSSFSSSSLKMASLSTTSPLSIYRVGRFRKRKSTSSSWCKLMWRLFSTGIVIRDSTASCKFSIGLPVRLSSTIWVSWDRSFGSLRISLSLKLICLNK